MAITRVSISIGRTVNLGNYESLRMEITSESDINEGRTPDQTLDDLEAFVTKSLTRRIKIQAEALRS